MTNRSDLALLGGTPVRTDLLPYGRQLLEEEDVAAVMKVLWSDWLTTGPEVGLFEKAFADSAGTEHAVAVANGTAALHAAMHAIGVKSGDEVIVPAMTFAATANCVLYCGAKPVIVDVEPETLLIDPAGVDAAITPRTRAVISVDYAGHPCDYDSLRSICTERGLALVADACHALGGSYKDSPVGSLADMSTFSFHPVKHIATGEGGMVATDNEKLVERLRVFRNHGITTDHRQRAEQGSWFYEMVELGYNYRLSDVACVLGRSQLRKLEGWVRRRRAIAVRYREAFTDVEGVEPLEEASEVRHAYHLFVIRLRGEIAAKRRTEVFAALRAEGIGVNVHYIPVHLHPYYRKHLGTGPGMCPVAEKAYGEILSLPMFPAMTDADVEDVLKAISKVIRVYS